MGGDLGANIPYPFFLYIKTDKPLLLKSKYIWIFYVIGIISSLFIEHLSLAISLVTVIYVIELAVRKQKIPINLIGLSTTHFLGSLFLISAKGDLVRSSFENVLPLGSRVINNFNLSFSTLGWILVFFWLASLTNTEFLQDFKKSTIWLIFATLGFTILIYSFAPTELTFINRVAFPFEVLVILGIAYFSKFLPKVIAFEISLFLILSLLAYGHGYTALLNLQSVDAQVSERNAIIQKAKENGNLTVSVPAIKLPGETSLTKVIIDKYNYKSDITSDPNSWENQCFANATGLKSITVSTKGY